MPTDVHDTHAAIGGLLGAYGGVLLVCIAKPVDVDERGWQGCPGARLRRRRE